MRAAPAPLRAASPRIHIVRPDRLLWLGISVGCPDVCFWWGPLVVQYSSSVRASRYARLG